MLGPPHPDLLARFQVSLAEWLHLPAVTARRLERRFQLERFEAERATEDRRRKERARFQRESIRREKIDDRWSACGIRWYASSPYSRSHGSWTHCHDCRQPLVWYDSPAEATAHRRECRRV